MIVDNTSEQCLECGEYFDEEHMCSHLRKVDADNVENPVEGPNK